MEGRLPVVVYATVRIFENDFFKVLVVGRKNNPFMPFGSMMNAFGQMHQQKPLDTEEFIASANKIFKACEKIVEGALENSTPKRITTDAYGEKSRLKAVKGVSNTDTDKAFL